MTLYNQCVPLSEIRAFLKRFSIPIGIFSFVIIAGSVGYYLLWRPYNATWPDAIYMTFITVTTVGYRELHPVEGIGRLLTVTIALMGIGSLFYLFTAVMEFFVAQQLRDPYGRKAMQRHIETLRNHTIVAGFGRMGRTIAEKLHEQRKPFVVVDKELSSEAFCFEKGYPCVIGDAEEDDILEHAGIHHAGALIAATGNDAANAFIVMSARALNPSLFIVARAEEDAALRKLQKAGANQTINPYAIAGQRLVKMLLQPESPVSVNEAPKDRPTEPNVQEFLVPMSSSFVGSSLGSLNLHGRTGVKVIALTRAGNLIHPSAETVLEANDVLIALGNKEQLEAFKSLVTMPSSEVTPSSIIKG